MEEHIATGPRLLDHFAGVKLLLKKNATVLARDSSRKTPLCRAAETCQRDVVKLLASLGDVNQLMPEPNGPCLTHR